MVGRGGQPAGGARRFVPADLGDVDLRGFQIDAAVDLGAALPVGGVGEIDTDRLVEKFELRKTQAVEGLAVEVAVRDDAPEQVVAGEILVKGDRERCAAEVGGRR